MSKLTFSCLPDVCLLLVFDKIALDDLLLNVNLVNRHWNTISAVASQHRKRLVLSLSFNSNKPFGLIIDSAFTDPFKVIRSNWHYLGGAHQSLIVPEARLRLNRKSIEHLVERLPNIGTLEVELNRLDISTSEHLATLINGWRDQLVTLKLFTDYSGDGNQSLLDGLAQLTNLHTTINSLPVLHHLTYQLDFPFINQNHYQIESLTFPIACPSLKELYFSSKELQKYKYSHETLRLFSNAFRDYVQSKEASGLRKIACIVSKFNQLDDFIATTCVLPSKTTHISIHLSQFTETNLMIIFKKFYNLTHISYEVSDGFSIEKLSKYLSILANLKHISLTYLDYTMDADEFEEAWAQNNNSVKRVMPQIDQIVPLIQIKSVYIDFQNLRWHQFMAEDLCFDLVFPSVELISIQNYDYACINCDGYFDEEMRKTTRKSEWHNCIGQFLAPIAKCDKLKRIDYTDGFDLDFCCSLDCFKFHLDDFID